MGAHEGPRWLGSRESAANRPYMRTVHSEILMTEKCPKCRAPVLHEGDRYQFDSSRFHMDAVKKLSEISSLMGEVESLTAEAAAEREVRNSVSNHSIRQDQEIESLSTEVTRMDKRTRHLLNRIEDAELALKVWDESKTSEYWERYPESERGKFTK